MGLLPVCLLGFLALSVSSEDAKDIKPRRHRRHESSPGLSCWEDEMPGSFLQLKSKPAAPMSPVQSKPGDTPQEYKSWNWFYNDKMSADNTPPNKWANVPKLAISGPDAQTKGAGWENAFPGKGLDFKLWGPLLGEMPGFAGALFGRSLFSGCKCESCVYSIDTLVMYLDEDTMGMFDESDIDRILMDRFCYGIKWMYRSACHHIMSNYYEDVVDMVMTYYTGWDICRQLRFCPWFLNDPLNTAEGAPGANGIKNLGSISS